MRFNILYPHDHAVGWCSHCIVYLLHAEEEESPPPPSGINGVFPHGQEAVLTTGSPALQQANDVWPTLSFGSDHAKAKMADPQDTE